MKALCKNPIYVPARECAECGGADPALIAMSGAAPRCLACNGAGQLPAVLVAREPVTRAELEAWVVDGGYPVDDLPDDPQTDADAAEFCSWLWERDAEPCECTAALDEEKGINQENIRCRIGCGGSGKVVRAPRWKLIGVGADYEQMTVVEYIPATDGMLTAAGIIRACTHTHAADQESCSQCVDGVERPAADALFVAGRLA